MLWFWCLKWLNDCKTYQQCVCVFGSSKHTECNKPRRVANVQSWVSYQISKIADCACAGNAGNVFPRRRFQRKPLVSDPGMHHGTCVTHVPWCMSRSLTCGDGENVPGIPGACAPTILRIWQEAHVIINFYNMCLDVRRICLDLRKCKALQIISSLCSCNRNRHLHAPLLMLIIVWWPALQLMLDNVPSGVCKYIWHYISRGNSWQLSQKYHITCSRRFINGIINFCITILKISRLNQLGLVIMISTFIKYWYVDNTTISTNWFHGCTNSRYAIVWFTRCHSGFT